MKNLVLLAAVLFGVVFSASAEAKGPRRGFGLASRGNAWANHHASSSSWHGSHYYLPYGQPTAVVVPPNAIMQQTYAWGVSQNLMMPAYHQYSGPAIPGGGSPFYATPRWPSSTTQFGLYNVRSPW